MHQDAESHRTSQSLLGARGRVDRSSIEAHMPHPNPNTLGTKRRVIGKGRVSASTGTGRQR